MSEPRGKILVVDDEFNVAQMLAEYLTEQGYQVATAHGGIEALAKIDLEKPQVIDASVARARRSVGLS